MICRKCNASATLVIRKEYWYCDTCFINNTNHKFRACLGKSKTLQCNENVLVCLSGSASSTVLLDLVHSGISLTGTKTLRINPYFLHVIETVTEDDTRKANSVKEQCKKYNFDLYMINITEYDATKKILVEPNIIQRITSESMHSNVSATTIQDLVIKIKQHLFLKVANQLHCKIIFTAETTTQLAKRLLSNLTIGRGSQVENDIGFADKRDDTIRILRPMRDITDEEINYFVKVNGLKPVCGNGNKEISLQLVIDNFVLNLEENSPSTISTICKTADKLGSLENTMHQNKCTLCQSTIMPRNATLTAVEATIFSRKMCFNKQTRANNEIEPIKCNNDDTSSMFPHIYETLCYSCSRNFSEIENNCKLSTK